MVAPEGTSFLDFDFSQIELRVGAFYCRDPRMMETYRSGGDIHASTTSVIFGISVDEAQDKDDPDYKERRTIAKNVNFARSTVCFRAVCSEHSSSRRGSKRPRISAPVSLLT